MSKYNVEKKDYVDLMSKVLQPLVDFGSCEYTNVYSTGSEFVKLSDSMGGARFIDVTSQDKESILLEVLELLMTGNSSHVINSKQGRREVAKLFM